MASARAAVVRLTDELRLDVRYAIRMLGRAPAFTAVAAGILAVGIGATTAIFSAVNAVVLRPLPYVEPDRLVRLYSTTPRTTPFDEATAGDFVAWRRGNAVFEHMAPIETRGMTLDDGTQLPEQVTAVRTSADYFPLLGVRALHGRTFLPGEDTPGGERVAVLSHRFWQRRFGGDGDVVGRTIRLNSVPFTITGVMPAAFDRTAADVDLWAPIAFTAEDEARFDIGYLDVIARLRPGVSVARAQAEMSALARRNAEAGGNEERGIRVVPYMADFVGPSRARLLVLLGAVGLVLLIACVNVANLLLARASGRAREMAVRAALGAGRGRVVRQLLAESLMLGLLGGAAGMVCAFLALHALQRSSPEGVPRLEQAALDASALVFALAISLASSVVFGLVPAFRAAGTKLYGDLRQAGRSSAGAARERLRQALVVVEVALSLILLVGAGLLIRTAIHTQRVDSGLDLANVWSGRITLPAIDYPTPEQKVLTFERITEGVRSVPGVRAAAILSIPPFSGLRALGGFVPEGRPVDAENALLGNLRLASPGVFATLGIPVVTGRDFSERDDASAPPVVLVNETFAALAWPGQDVVGKRLYGPGGGANGPLAREVIGVVGDIREDGLREEPRPAVYYPLRQVPPPLWEGVQNSLVVLARTATEPLAATGSVRAVLQNVDRGLAVADVQSLEQRMGDSLAAARFNTRMLSALGAAGLLLAAVGIYAVIAFFVSQRTSEIGVRMALGATPGHVVRLVVGQGLRPVMAGVVLGGGAAVAATRVLESQLYGVGATDPTTFVIVTALIGMSALLASAVPARRAARVEPNRALES